MAPEHLHHQPGQDWLAIVRKNGTAEFSAAFAKSPVLDASVMDASCVGVDNIAAFFKATSSMYDVISFTDETISGTKTYLEWEGKFGGLDVAGSTILTRDLAGSIRNIRLYHRPLHMVARFSAELAERLTRHVDPVVSHITPST